MNFKVSQLKSLTAGEVAVDDLIYVIDSNPTDGSVKSKKVTVGDLIDSRIYGISSSQFVLITGYYADPSWISSLDWSKITNAPSFVTSLSALTDVQLSTPLPGQALVYNGSKWVNQGIGELDTLNSVTTRGNTTTNAITVGGLTVATNLIYTDTVNGRVGIGTTSPTWKLEASSAGYTAFGIMSGANNNAEIHFQNTGYSIPRWTIRTTGTPNGSSGNLAFQRLGSTFPLTITSGDNVLIGFGTDAGYKLDVNGTARTSQLHTFSQGTYLDALTANYFHTVDTGSGSYGGLALKNSINNYSALIYTGRSGASNSIVFDHLTYSGSPTAQGSQKFSLTGTTFGVANNSTYGHTLTIHQRSGGVATYPLVITNQINTTNSGVGILMQTADSTAAGPINSASIVSWKQNLTAPNVTSDMRFSTISDAANTLSEKMRISSAGNLLVGTTTDSGAKVTVAGSITAASALAQGVYFNNTLVAAANNDVLVGLDINPTFTNGAFTGLSNYAARIQGTVVINAPAFNVTNSLYVGGSAGSRLNNIIIGGSYGSTTITDAGGASTLTLSTTGFGFRGGFNTLVPQAWLHVRNVISTSPIFRLDSTAGTQLFTVLDSGNTLIGTTTDAGYKLDVNGTARVQGNLAATGNYVQFGTNVNVGIGSTSNGATFVNNGLALVYCSANINNAINLYGHNFYTGNYNATSGTQGVISLTGPPTFSPTSGTAVFNALNLAFTINQTGGANGITRGLYVNPTITAAADFRAIETTAGNIIFNGGNVGIGLTPTNKLDIAYATGVTNRFISFGIRSGLTADHAEILFTNVSTGHITTTTGSLQLNPFGNSINTNFGLSILQLTASSNYGLYSPTARGLQASTNAAMGFLSVNGDVNTDSFIFSGPTGARHFFKVVQNNVPYFTIMPTGNVLINTTTDSGYKLDVNGTARVNNIFYVTNSAYTGSLRIEAFANHQQRIIGAYGENITFGAGGNTMNLNAGETYFSGSLLGGGFWMQSNGNTVIGAQSTPPASALVEIRSTTKGFLKPRLTTTEKSAITSPATGLEVYDSTTNTPNYFNGTTWVGVASNQSTGLSPGLFSQTSDSVAVTNTTVESNLISTGVGTLSVPANGFQVGAAYIAYFSGVMSSQNNATMEIHLRSNGFVLADTNPMILSATTGKFWELHVNFVIRAIGGGGVAAIVTSGRFSYNKNSGNNPESLGFSGVNNTTFDTTINNTLAVTATWGNASPADSIQTRIFNLYRVY
jgi:hypothetical protein